MRASVDSRERASMPLPEPSALTGRASRLAAVDILRGMVMVMGMVPLVTGAFLVTGVGDPVSLACIAGRLVLVAWDRVSSACAVDAGRFRLVLAAHLARVARDRVSSDGGI